VKPVTPWRPDQVNIFHLQIEITVFKYGSDVHIRYVWKDSMALDMDNLPAKIRVNPANEWSVIFGIPTNPSDGELTTRLACIASHWEPASGFTTPWQIRLEGQPVRCGEDGDTYAIALRP
jgi:hypothetical protein